MPTPRQRRRPAVPASARYKLVAVIPPVHEGLRLLARRRRTTLLRVVQEALTAYLRLYEADIRAERERSG